MWRLSPPQIRVLLHGEDDGRRDTQAFQWTAHLSAAPNQAGGDCVFPARGASY